MLTLNMLSLVALWSGADQRGGDDRFLTIYTFLPCELSVFELRILLV